MAFAHFNQARPAIFSVKRADKRPHDRTSLLAGGTVRGDCFKESAWAWENGFVEAGKWFPGQLGDKTCSGIASFRSRDREAPGVDA